MIRIVISLLAAFMLFASLPAFADETKTSKDSKDECLLLGQNCANRVDSLQDKIQKLNNEIKKGTKVYSQEELKKLNKDLQDLEDFVDLIMQRKQ
jgi:peptidoglycan hydrolase CwlO-like protein